ncbi:MAG: 4-(cytidine 5'-diphospho)-2-C-methyl-D-erythritol kinase [Candidatus Omnitrophica bacterium]|nr:4-(cytidine 5'-diphospho)-2-C-methyl-D-erythritol kinase [Candidatus Omnitrophota bacterium]
MSRIVLSSPAKLNLFLKVQNKRPDGYHNIVTVFERIDLSDEIDFRTTIKQNICIQCDHPDVPLGPRNLIYKAARLLQEEFKTNQGAEVKIKKRIPVAAGLAGGSSNAATALLGLNHIWKLNLSRTELLPFARKIGSDVAFFLHDTSFGLGRGRGDDIKPLNIKTNLWHILVVPRIKMYSWKVYGGLKMRLRPSSLPSESDFSRQALGSSPGRKGESTNVLTKIIDNANILIHNLKKGNILEVGRSLDNDLESEIIRLLPSLVKLKKRLKSLNVKGVMISGSGPSVFGLTLTRNEAELMRPVLLKRFSQVFVVKTL